MNFSHDNSSVPSYYIIDYENSKEKDTTDPKFIVYRNRNYKETRRKKNGLLEFSVLTLAADR